MIFFILAFVLYFVISAYFNNPAKVQKVECKLHRWEYDTDNFLFCTVCKKKPGEILGEQ